MYMSNTCFFLKLIYICTKNINVQILFLYIYIYIYIRMYIQIRNYICIYLFMYKFQNLDLHKKKEGIIYRLRNQA